MNRIDEWDPIDIDALLPPAGRCMCGEPATWRHVMDVNGALPWDGTETVYPSCGYCPREHDGEDRLHGMLVGVSYETYAFARLRSNGDPDAIAEMKEALAASRRKRTQRSALTAATGDVR